MIGSIRKMHDRLRGRGAANGEAAAPYYVSIDGTQVDILAHARMAALDNLPATGAEEPNDVETAIEREHQRRHRDAVEKTRTTLQSLGAEFDHLERELPTTRVLEVAVQEAMAAIDRDLATDTSLAKLLRHRGRRDRDLRGLVNAHQLSREPHYPQSRVLHLAWLAPIVLVESIVNAAFLAPATSWGLAGGFFVAVGVSLVNAVAGVLAGYFPMRWLHRLELPMRRLGMTGTLAYGAFALVFNLGLACFRDAAAARGAQHLGVDQLLRHAGSLSFESLALLAVGLLATALSARKGYTLDDVVPRYGHAHRAFTAADQDFAAGHDQLRQQVVGHAGGVPERSRAIVQRASDVLDRMGQLIAEVERVVEAYEAERERIERWCLQWLRRYRAVNESIRTSPAPPYFREYPKFDSQVDGTMIHDLKAKLGHSAGRLDELRAKAHDIGDRQPEFVAHARERFERFLEQSTLLAESGRLASPNGYAAVNSQAEELP